MGYDGYSLSDIAAVSGNRGNDGYGFGDGAWWIIIFLIFALGGWNNNGFGGNGATNGALTRGDLCQDMNFNDLQNAVRSSAAENNANFRTVDNAVCTLGYDNLVQANGINMNIANGFSRLDTSLCQSFNNVAQQVNGLSSQIATCCCDNLRALDGVNYNISMNTNQIQNAMCNNTRAILDAITANRIEDKNAQITAQQNEINALRLAASQEKQNNYLIDQLKPCPIPAYITCNPYQSYGFTYANNGVCGCNNNF